MCSTDDIAYDGSFVRETYNRSRHQSVCSNHLDGPVSKITTICISSPNGKESYDKDRTNSRHRKHNNSFHHTRFLVVFLGGISVGLMSLLRLNITVAILNMVNQTQIYIEENPEADVEAYFGEDYLEVGEFEWDNEIQQLIISYYMIAYTLPQLFTTKLALRIGIKYSISISVALCATSCLLTPFVAYYGWQYVVILRLMNGLGASAILPVMVYMIELWMPKREATLGLAIVQTVQSVIFTLSPLISGALSEIHWKWAFYVPASAALIFCCVWMFLVCDKPSECWFISQQELDIICGCNDIINNHCCSGTTTDSLDKSGNSASANRQPEAAVSWTRALRLKSFHALALVWIFYQSSFGAFSFLNPSYMRQVLKVPIMENGMLCFIIQSGCMISVIWPQPIISCLTGRFNYSLTTARRMVVSSICTIAIVTWLTVAQIHKYQVFLFSINRIFHLSIDTLVTGTIMSQYANTGVGSMVYSIINAIGNLTTVFFCMAVGKFLDLSGQSKECWSWIFVSMSAMNVGLMLLYNTMISSEPIEFDTANSLAINERNKRANVELKA